MEVIRKRSEDKEVDHMAQAKMGESKEVQIPPEKGYGNYKEERAITMDKKEFPSDLVPVEGMSLEICTSEGTYVPAQITDVTETTVTLDANHPLVEQTLYFDIKLLEITKSMEKSAQ